MKAIVQDRYGSADVLEYKEVDRPVAGPGELLVRVRAAAVNAYDWHFMRGDPYLARLSMGLRRPKKAVRGRDFAGTVEAVGEGVTRFSAGDEVFGEVDGTFAEYVSVAETSAGPKPAGLTFEQAAAVPLAGNTALIGVRDLGEVRPGQRVLVNGASGGVGTFAVQIAKAYGAEVTAVCSTRNVDLVRSLGADHVVDYKLEDFSRNGVRYDVVLDFVANRTLTDFRRALKPGGTLVLAGGGVSDGGTFLGPIALLLRSLAVKPFVSHRVRPLTAANNPANLAALAELIESGQVKPVIDRGYPLEEAADAIRYLELEHATAKVVITV
jgi:NADPH:quinone reductase-like Zn-dependent oxidoreductase